MNLTGWQRLGIVLSILWWIACICLFLVEYYETSPFSTTLFVSQESNSIFSFIPLEIAGLSSTGTVAEVNLPMTIFALTLPLILWLTGTACMLVTRWIANGFEPPRAEPPVLTNPIITRQFEQPFASRVE